MKSQVLTGKPVVFVTLFLDSSKITEDTLCVLRDPLTRKMMAEWELFIPDAQEEWIEFEARHPFAGYGGAVVQSGGGFVQQ